MRDIKNFDWSVRQLSAAKRIEGLEEQMKVLKEAETQANKKFSKYAQDTKVSLEYLKATNGGLKDELTVSLERWNT